MNYLLSIVVPTKNRYRYLKSIIEMFISMNTHHVQLVIQDNSDDNSQIVDCLKDYCSKDIKYCYLEKHISVSENCNAGIEQANGKYVCLIGDDDAVSSNILDVVKYMDLNDVESAIFNKAKYYWPDIKFRVHKMPSLTIRRFSGRVTKKDAMKELRRCLRKGATSLLELPHLYHGVVKKEALDKVYSKCQTYFPGASPDMASAIALSLIIKSHIYVDAPFIISGQAYNSAGGKGTRNEHKGKLSEIEWLPDNIEEAWEDNIPRIWTGATIYADSAHKALRAMGKEEYINLFNYSYNYASFRSFNSEYKYLLKEIIKRDTLKYFKIYIYMIEIFGLRLSNFISSIFRSRFRITFSRVYFDIDNSNAASKIVTDALVNGPRIT